jgi:hypothetical protein
MLHALPIHLYSLLFSLMCLCIFFPIIFLHFHTLQSSSFSVSCFISYFLPFLRISSTLLLILLFLLTSFSRNPTPLLGLPNFFPLPLPRNLLFPFSYVSVLLFLLPFLFLRFIYVPFLCNFPCLFCSSLLLNLLLYFNTFIPRLISPFVPSVS